MLVICAEPTKSQQPYQSGPSGHEFPGAGDSRPLDVSVAATALAITHSVRLNTLGIAPRHVDSTVGKLPPLAMGNLRPGSFHAAFLPWSQTGYPHSVRASTIPFPMP
jgi:hypothetical protein